jgi:carbonic anhydrase
MAGLSCSRIMQKISERGIAPEVVETLKRAGINLEQWLVGFEHPRDGVLQSVEIIKHHPLLPKGLPVHGMLMCPETGKLDLVVDGYEAR